MYSGVVSCISLGWSNLLSIALCDINTFMNINEMNNDIFQHVKNNDIETVVQLLGSNSHLVHARDEHFCTPLHYVQTVEMFVCLMRSGARICAYDDNRFYIELNNDRKGICEIYNINKVNTYSFVYALHGYHDIMKYICEFEATDENAVGITPFHYMISSNNFELIHFVCEHMYKFHGLKYLLEVLGNQENTYRLAPVHFVRSIKVLELFVKYGVDLWPDTKYKQTIVHMVCCNAWIDNKVELLKRIQKEYENGNISACKSEAELKVPESEAKASTVAFFRLKDVFGNTALHYCIDTEVIDFFIENIDRNGLREINAMGYNTVHMNISTYGGAHCFKFQALICPPHRSKRNRYHNAKGGVGSPGGVNKKSMYCDIAYRSEYSRFNQPQLGVCTHCEWVCSYMHYISTQHSYMHHLEEYTTRTSIGPVRGRNNTGVKSDALVNPSKSNFKSGCKIPQHTYLSLCRHPFMIHVVMQYNPVDIDHVYKMYDADTPPHKAIYTNVLGVVVSLSNTCPSRYLYDTIFIAMVDVLMSLGVDVNGSCIDVHTDSSTSSLLPCATLNSTLVSSIERQQFEYKKLLSAHRASGSTKGSDHVLTILPVLYTKSDEVAGLLMEKYHAEYDWMPSATVSADSRRANGTPGMKVNWAPLSQGMASYISRLCEVYKQINNGLMQISLLRHLDGTFRLNEAFMKCSTSSMEGSVCGREADAATSTNGALDGYNYIYEYISHVHGIDLLRTCKSKQVQQYLIEKEYI